MILLNHLRHSTSLVACGNDRIIDIIIISLQLCKSLALFLAILQVFLE